MPAARFKLAAHINVRQPNSQQNKNPSPRQPGARRDETLRTLTTAALAALAEVKQICLQITKESEWQCMAAGLCAFCIPDF